MEKNPATAHGDAGPGDSSFEIHDFTQASDWEKFIYRLEEIITKWGLSRNGDETAALKDGKLTTMEVVSYVGHYFQLTYHFPNPAARRTQLNDLTPSQRISVGDEFPEELKNTMDIGTDFPSPSRTPLLCRWYGYSRFLTLTAVAEGGLSLSEAQMMLSSLILALDTCKCELPALVPIRKPSSGDWIGYCAGRGVSANIRSIQLPSMPPNYTSLQGVLDLFSSKLGLPLSSLQLSVSTRYTYMCGGADEDEWRGTKIKDLIRWGPESDPCQATHLAITWHQFLEEEALSNVIVPRPQDLLVWYIRCVLHPNPKCPFTDTFRNLYSIFSQAQSYTSVDQLRDALSDSPLAAVSSTLSDPLARSPSLQEITQILRDLFTSVGQPSSPSDHFWMDMKSAPSSSLLATLATHMFKLNSFKGIALLWLEFVREVRWAWDRSVTLPQCPPSVDFRACLLHQKLQMMNYCIMKARKQQQQRVREEEAKGAEDNKRAGEVVREGVKGVLPLQLLSGEPMYEPEIQEHGMMTELSAAQDMVREQEEMFAKLGSSAEAAEVRARIQAATLKSDMSAFKAANPGCVLEDFVRWHSPRDWIEEGGRDLHGAPVSPSESPPPLDSSKPSPPPDGDAASAPPVGEANTSTGDAPPVPWPRRNSVKGRLSARMLAPGNLWHQVWNEAEPVPISRQEPLFNHVIEAEKVLHYLETLSPSDLVAQIMRVLASLICSRWSALPAAAIPAIHKELENLHAAFLSLADHIDADAAENVCQAIRRAEVLVSRATSLLEKFPNEIELVETLLEKQEIFLRPSSSVRAHVLRLFAGEENGDIGEPEAREYIVRSLARRPLPCSRPVPNRMYILINEAATEYRICTVLSLDE